MKVSNALAAWLILLILLPFTARFSTCEIPNQLKHGSLYALHMDTAIASDTAAALAPAPRALRIGQPTTVVAASPDSVASTLRSQALRTVLRL